MKDLPCSLINSCWKIFHECRQNAHSLKAFITARTANPTQREGQVAAGTRNWYQVKPLQVSHSHCYTLVGILLTRLQVSSDFQLNCLLTSFNLQIRPDLAPIHLQKELFALSRPEAALLWLPMEQQRGNVYNSEFSSGQIFCSISFSTDLVHLRLLKLLKPHHRFLRSNDSGTGEKAAWG